MKAIFFSFCLIFSLLTYGQKKSNLSSTDHYAQQTDEKRSLNKLTAKSLDHMSIPGGAVTGYYENTALVLIYTTYGAEHGYISYSYYLRHDSLLLVKELKEFWKFSNEEDYERFEDYRKTHTDEKGVTDLSGWPMETDDDNAYYFQDTLIVDFNIRSFKKTKTVTEKEIADMNKDLMRRLRIHCGELAYVRGKKE